MSSSALPTRNKFEKPDEYHVSGLTALDRNTLFCTHASSIRVLLILCCMTVSISTESARLLIPAVQANPIGVRSSNNQSIDATDGKNTSKADLVARPLAKIAFEPATTPGAGTPKQNASTDGSRSKVQKQVDKAQHLVQTGKLKEARSVIDRVLETNPRFEQAIFVRAQIRNASKDYKGGADDYSKLLALNPNHAAYHVGIAECYGARANASELVVMESSAAIALSPSYGYAYYLRGNAYTKLNRLKEAGTDYSKLIELDPILNGYPCLIQNLTMRRHWGELIKRCTEWIDGSIHTGVAKNIGTKLLASFYAARAKAEMMKTDQGEKAALDALKAIKLDRENFEAIDILRQVELRNPVLCREVLTQLDQWLSRHSDDRILVQRARLLTSLGDLSRAQRDTERLIAIHPDEPTSYMALALIQIKKKDYLGAINTYTKLSANRKSKKIALWERAALYREMSMFDKAIADYSTLLELSPDTPELYFCRSRLYERIGAVAQANSDRKKALNMFLSQ